MQEQRGDDQRTRSDLHLPQGVTWKKGNVKNVTLKVCRVGKLEAVLVASVVLVTATAIHAQNTGPTVVRPEVVRTDFDMRKVAVPPALNENELKGRRLFVQHCDFCHGTGEGQRTIGPVLHEGTGTTMGEANVRAKIAMGSAEMPGFRYSLESIQVDHIIAYLATVRSAVLR